jgi:hypothetical protein
MDHATALMAKPVPLVLAMALAPCRFGIDVAFKQQSLYISCEERDQNVRPDIAGATAKANHDSFSGVALIGEAEFAFSNEGWGFASLRSVKRFASMFSFLIWSTTALAKLF